MDVTDITPSDFAESLINFFEEHDMDDLDCLIFIKDLEDELALLRDEIEKEIALG